MPNLMTTETSHRAPVGPRNLRDVSFDPDSPGAQRLARSWARHRVRWQVRILPGRTFLEGDGRLLRGGDLMDVAGFQGRELVDAGTAEFVSQRTVSAHDSL
jgi:hypothetical protein